MDDDRGAGGRVSPSATAVCLVVVPARILWRVLEGVGEVAADGALCLGELGVVGMVVRKCYEARARATDERKKSGESNY